MSDGRVQIALHAPNLVNVCIDGKKDGVYYGRLYHCFSKEAWKFENIVQMIELMETLYNSINYPQASTEARNFDDGKTVELLNLKKLNEQKEIVLNRGTEGTFLIHVQYRQNSSWQGQVEWLEKSVMKKFSSELDLIKLITAAIEE